MNNIDILNNTNFGEGNLNFEKLIKILLENRSLKSKSEINDFLNPKLDSVTPKNLGIDRKEINKAKKRLDIAKKENERIVIYGDYDVDGITGTTILWEIIYENKYRVMPYIPDRNDEGYGLSVKGIDNLLKKYPDLKLIITVDNGIVANEAVNYAKENGIDVIITDHHVPGKKLPDALAIIHSTKVCGCAVAYVFVNELFKVPRNYLELVAMATVSDVMKLTFYNRILLKFGLDEIRKSKRIGLNKLIETAGVEKEKIGVYELGNIIGPRINAMGRIGSGMDSLRLLCTTNNSKARQLANELNNTNIKRQQMTFDSTDHARIKSSNKKKIIVLSDESYNPGIVGLISGRISEEFYKPSVIISKGKIESRGSARSIKGVDIISLLREAKDLLVAVGGHPGAAGFTIETKNIPKFKKRLEDLAEKSIDDKLLIRKVRVDVKLPIRFVDLNLYIEIQKLSPFGFGNPEPAFLAEKVRIESLKVIGKESKHIKLDLLDEESNKRIQGLLFNYDKKLNLEPGKVFDLVYGITLNVWNGNKNLELKLKNIL